MPIESTMNDSQMQAFYVINDVLDDGANSTTSVATFMPDVQLDALEEQQCMLFTKFVLNSVCAGMICLLGLFGNGLSWIVLSKDKETPVASFLLQALAFTDNFFLTIWLVHFSLNDLFSYLGMGVDFYNQWIYVRLYTYPLLFVGQTATIWMTVLIAVSRYIAVCKPYKAVQYCSIISMRKAVCSVLLFAVIYNIPRFFETKIITKPHNGTEKYHYARTGYADTYEYNLVYFDILYYIFMFVVPLLLLATLNTLLTIAYRSIQHRRNSMRSVGRREHIDNNITLVMIIVVLVFMICNCPARLVQILWRYKPHACLTTKFFLNEISIILEVLNSSANFIVYCAFRKQFRLILQSRFCSGRSAQAAAAAISISRTVTSTMRGEEQEFLQQTRL